MPPKPRRIHVDGHELVVLTRAAYENLEGQRRRVGAQGARLHALRTELDQFAVFVDRLERAAAALPECSPGLCAACARAGGECARKTLITALAERPKKARGR
ncbi:hypothetical protein BAY61_18595 [Prauserella marina]|uniref:Uncharacterized protein n=1 Tax=Prauserella marina TaxID=530584 RepID=A0A222VRZ5_9PSEU|nr:hypothetical protein [Prauserella marina]ASR36679.1 hypothetical protein BAY61_18595 [Prauserella marina]PWV74103.1 hypothetical protein DES30_108277 [Prauserella marina]SDD63140.1 hypothetical protein SAMN05421630_110278 [Prauserella marina]